MILSLIALALLVSLSAFFSGSETILFSLSSAQRSRIRARNPKADRALSVCLENSAMLLSTLLVGNTFVNFSIATIGYMLFVRLMPSCGGFLAIPVMTVFLLLFGEILPKRLALAYTEALAPRCAQFLLFWRAVLKPFNLAFSFSAKAFARAVERERRALSDTELVSVLKVASENGDFASEDAEMIAGVLRLSELHANDEMTPRVDIIGIDCDTLADDQMRQQENSQHRFLPIYHRTPDCIKGVLDTRTGNREDALFVPEQISLDDLLVTFRRSGKSFAIVTDEYGGTAGLITLDDVMELIMGPKVFAHREAEPQIRQISARTWIIDARASLEEINREIGLKLEAEDADRLAGWLAQITERIPHVGQHIEAQGCRATVLRRRGRRVLSVMLEILAFPETSSDAELLAETDEQVEKTEEENDL